MSENDFKKPIFKDGMLESRLTTIKGFYELSLNKKLAAQFKKKAILFIYVDCDLYEETLKILNFIDHKITKGGIIAFDEALRNTKKGEAKALKEFYQTRKKKYKLIKRLKFYQPDILLIRN